MYIQETYINNKGEKLNIISDDNVESPRDYDNISSLIIKNSINETDYRFKDEVYDNEEDAILKICKDVRKHFGKDILSVTPIYKYEHSGVTYALTPFGCKWDSGFCGVMVVLKSSIRSQLGIKRVTVEKQVQGQSYANSEFSTYVDWVEGNCLRFEILDKNDKEIESCGGFIGSDIKTNGILDYVPQFKELIICEREAQIHG